MQCEPSVESVPWPNLHPTYPASYLSCGFCDLSQALGDMHGISCGGNLDTYVGVQRAEMHLVLIRED